ncbi:uncharacterized protein [Pyrus communis]|uniref:uncharacterized protein n=1 Tax=Pyrus communis TaxID=23211 RepID=UPI0035C21122
MLMRGDRDLNSVQAYTGSLNDVLRKTMLSQEIVFKKQVHQLHHLYRIQKTLMQNLGPVEFGGYNYNIAGAESNLLPLKNYARDEPMDLLEGCKGVDDKIQPRTPELKLPSDQFLSYIDPAEVKLSLSIQEDNRIKGGTMRTWFDLETHSGSQHVIDLEESIERTSNEGLEQSPSFSSTAPITSVRGTHNLEVSVLFDPIISSSVKKNLLFHAAESYPHLDGRERNPFNQGLEKCSGGIAINNSSTRRELFGSYETGVLDLNKIQYDDSSCLSNDRTVAHLSTASSSHLHRLVGKVEEGTHCFGTGKKQNSNSSIESSERFQKYNAGNLKVDGSSISGMGNESLEAASRSKIDPCEAVGFHSSDPSNENNGFIMKLLNSRSSSCTSAKQVNCENNKIEDPVFPYTDNCQKTDRDGHGNISSASCKPCCNAEDDSSSGKTMQSEIEFGNSNPLSVDQFSGTHGGSQLSETLMGEQDRRSSDNNELKHKDLNKGGDSAELDVLIRAAAEALVGISLESSSYYQDCAYEVGGSTKMETKESEQPQCSDSYELLTLNLAGSTEDTYCVSSKPSEVNYNDSKEFGVKLRRGRRMKDFQRDVLPGLASLSRHEIREDITIMETVLRSREYKKLRGKVVDGQSCCTPVKNKRSRLNYVPRRKRNLREA